MTIWEKAQKGEKAWWENFSNTIGFVCVWVFFITALNF